MRDANVTTNFQDVRAFQVKFGLPHFGDGRSPTPLDHDLMKFRGKFLLEELAEFFAASGYIAVATRLHGVIEYLDRMPVPYPVNTDLESAADALADLNYVSLGTAHFMAIPFDGVWSEVQRANMTKVRASNSKDPRSKRGHAADVVKPPGFRPPDHRRALECARVAAEEACRGHVASEADARVCGRCGVNILSLT
jgi:predicted HAD superfamily Cof-like phosphohydrolase